MAGLVVGRVAALFLRHDHGLPLRAHHDLVLGALEVVHLDQTLVAAGGEQRRLVHQVGQIGAGHAGRAARQDVRLHIGRHRHLAHVHHENLLAAADIRQRHHHLAVEAARAQQRGIEHVGTVGRGDHDHARVALEAVHLHQQLVQRLLALVVAAAQAGAALAADRIDFIDEHDARRMLLGLLEHVAHARGTHTDEHLDEVRTGNGEERHLGFAGDGLAPAGSCRCRGCRPSARRAECARPASGTCRDRAGNRPARDTSSLASSQPATSAKVTVLLLSSSMRARLLPNEKAPPRPPPCIWRMKNIHTPISSSIGNQDTKMFISKEGSSSGLASILTPFLSRSHTIQRSEGA